MPTVVIHGRCTNCGNYISLTKSSKTKISNFYLCPFCNRGGHIIWNVDPPEGYMEIWKAKYLKEKKKEYEKEHGKSA